MSNGRKSSARLMLPASASDLSVPDWFWPSRGVGEYSTYFVQVVGIYLNSAIFATWKSLQHGLTNYIDTKAKCHHLKNWPVKGLCGRCLFVWGPPYTLYSAKMLEEWGIDESRHGSRARPRHRQAFLFWFKLEPRIRRRGISNFTKTYWTQSRRVVFQNRTRTLDRFRGIYTPRQPP